jgi:hypothetical protein
MTRFFKFSLGVLALCLPQFVVSAIAIYAYADALIYPASGVGFHLALMLALHVGYFSAWGLLARTRGWGEHRWFRLLYALSLVGKGLALNLVYVCSYLSHQLWSAYISWDNLRALGPHLRGFHLALGAGFYWGCGLALGLLLASLVAALKLSAVLTGRLHRAYADSRAAFFSPVLFSVLGLLAGLLWLRNPQGEAAREADPILAFWSNRAAADPVLTSDMLADRQAGLAYVPPASFSRRNVIVIIIDCLRADHLSFRGYTRETTPFLTSLAREGRLQQVDFAISNGNDSPQGIRTILSSRYPHRQNFHNFRLQDLLKRAGYRTHVVAAGDHTTLGGMRRHYGSNVDVFSDGLDARSYSVNDDRGLLESLDKIDPAGDQPAFFFIHLMSAHDLAVREPRFSRWQPAQLELEWNAMILGRYDAVTMTNTYDNGVLQADHYLERVLTVLKAKGYLKDFVAVITGDHGEGLGERGNYGHTRFLYAEDITVPILFLESGQADYGPMPFASHVDIAPTLLDRLGLPRPDRWDGKSLLHAAAPELAFAAGTRESGWRAVVLRREGAMFKYLFYGNKLRAFQEHLYELISDPTEKSDLSANPAHEELLLEMRRRAAKEFARAVPPLD